ncbi:MAG: hypothetical protein FWD86_00075 [Firmicutes bacterium]|nr:hypothetical protein [Bacillota bacterium]
MYIILGAAQKRELVEEAIIERLKQIQFPAKAWLEKAEYKGMDCNGKGHTVKQNVIIVESEWGGKESIITCIAVANNLHVKAISCTKLNEKDLKKLAEGKRNDWFKQNFRDAINDGISIVVKDALANLGLSWVD